MILNDVILFLTIFFQLNSAQDYDTFGQWYNGSVYLNLTKKFNYNYIPNSNFTEALRITVNSDNAPKKKPILVVIKQERNVVSFQVPSSYDEKFYYRSVSRTLCPEVFEVGIKQTSNQMITIELSSFISEENLSKFSLRVDIIQDFGLGYQTSKEISVGTSEPQFYYFKYPPGIDSVVVRLSSDDDKCLVFSVQRAECPIEDSIGNVMFSGIYQSVTTQGAITMTKAQMSDLFVVVLVLRSSDFYCDGIETIQPSSIDPSFEYRRKSINLTIESTLERKNYVLPIVGAFLFYMTFYMAAGFIAYLYHTYDFKTKYNVEKIDEDVSERSDNESAKSERIAKYGTISNKSKNETTKSLLKEFSKSNFTANETAHFDLNSKTKKRQVNKTTLDSLSLRTPDEVVKINEEHNHHNKRHKKNASLTDFVFKAGIGRAVPVKYRKQPPNSEKYSRIPQSRKGLFSSSSEDAENDDEISFNHDLTSPTTEPAVSTTSPLESENCLFIDIPLKETQKPHTPMNLIDLQSESTNVITSQHYDSLKIDNLSPVSFEGQKKHDLFDQVHDMEDHADLDYDLPGTIYVSDLSRKRYTTLNRKYLLYFWYLIIISIFYGLPVAQLVMTYQEAIHNTGNEDLCYYNFKCAHPLGIFISFNNIVSNIGYIMLGILFLCLTFRRDIIQRRINNSAKYYSQDHGIPQHYGLYYAMGAALLMEGVMSGCYHICPSFSNFQFDTAYMYMLSMILMLKIYQTRHPDVNASAHSAYMVMAMVILLGFTGVVYGGETFWIVFTIVFLIMSICLTAEIYYMGQWNFDICLPRRLYNLIRTDGLSCFRPMYRERMLLLLVANCVNCGLAAYGIFARPKDFSSYLLSLFLINLLMYSAFYIIMKLRHNERILFLPLIYLVVASISWTFSLYFFINNSTTWQVTPAQSRAINRPCILFEFYDTHDVWHFLSSISMFFSFMGLMNLDDDLFHIPRDQIFVF